MTSPQLGHFSQQASLAAEVRTRFFGVAEATGERGQPALWTESAPNRAVPNNLRWTELQLLLALLH